MLWTSDRVVRWAVQAPLILALVGICGCGGETGGFPSGLGSGIVASADRKITVDVQWQGITDPAGSDTNALDLDNQFVNVNDAHLADDSLIPKVKRLHAPPTATWASVTIEGAGFNGDNIEMDIAPRNKLTGSPPGTDSGVPIRNDSRTFPEKVFRSGNHQVLVEFFTAKPPPGSSTGFIGFSAFQVTIPANDFHLMAVLTDSTTPIDVKDGRLVTANLSITGTPPPALSPTIHVTAQEVGAIVGGPLKAVQNITNQGDTTTGSMQLVDRGNPYQFEVHSTVNGSDGTALTTVTDTSTVSVPAGFFAGPGVVLGSDSTFSISFALTPKGNLELTNNGPVLLGDTCTVSGRWNDGALKTNLDSASQLVFDALVTPGNMDFVTDLTNGQYRGDAVGSDVTIKAKVTGSGAADAWALANTIWDITTLKATTMFDVTSGALGLIFDPKTSGKFVVPISADPSDGLTQLHVYIDFGSGKKTEITTSNKLVILGWNSGGDPNAIPANILYPDPSGSPLVFRATQAGSAVTLNLSYTGKEFASAALLNVPFNVQGGSAGGTIK